MSEKLIRRYFAAVDSLDFEDQIATVTPDVVFRFGNAPPITGHDALRAANLALLERVASIRHEIVGIWACEGCWSVETKVTYVDKQGRAFSYPACNLHFIRDGLFSEVRIFVDNHELFSAA